MVRYLQNLINDRSGFTAIEYALIAALMAVAAIPRLPKSASTQQRLCLRVCDIDPYKMICPAAQRPPESSSQWTPSWREMDSNFWYRGTKAVDFRSIPGIAGVSAGLLNDTT
jgi:hypothetical protein